MIQTKFIWLNQPAETLLMSSSIISWWQRPGTPRLPAGFFCSGTTDSSFYEQKLKTRTKHTYFASSSNQFWLLYDSKFLVGKLGVPHSFAVNDVAEQNRLNLLQQFHGLSFEHIYFSIMLFINRPNLSRFCSFSVNGQLKSFNAKRARVGSGLFFPSEQRRYLWLHPGFNHFNISVNAGAVISCHVHARGI